MSIRASAKRDNFQLNSTATIKQTDSFAEKRAIIKRLYHNTMLSPLAIAKKVWSGTMPIFDSNYPMVDTFGRPTPNARLLNQFDSFLERVKAVIRECEAEGSQHGNK